MNPQAEPFARGSFAAALGLERACFFGVGERVFAVPEPFVRGVVALPALTPLPHTPPELLGVCVLRGVVWPLFSLEKPFGLPVAAPYKLAVLVAQGERRAALGLDEALGFTPFDRGLLGPLSPTDPEDVKNSRQSPEQKFGLGMVLGAANGEHPINGKHHALLLDVPALLGALRERLTEWRLTGRELTGWTAQSV